MQTQESIFHRKKPASLHPVVDFDNRPVKSTQILKHIEMMLDSNLTCKYHTKSLLNKVNMTIDLLRKFQYILPKLSLNTFYKTFIKPCVHYGDRLYNRAFNESFY